MIKDNSTKALNHNRLPSLHKSNSKVLLKQEVPIPKLLFQQKSLPQFYDHPKNIQETKAQNFLNQTMTLCSPSVIFNLSDCVKRQYGKKFQNSKEFSEQNLIKSNFSKHFVPQKQNHPVKSMHVDNLNQSTFYQNDKKICFERKEMLNLAKWIDQKLQEFNSKKEISVEEIIDYKQHIINYGLGKIVDSVRKKSKQEGDLLKILWQNSFKIFQKVLQIVSNSICQKQKSHLDEQKQSKQIFDTNLSFLSSENLKISSELNNIYEKMKKIIIWNKKLRKQKKLLNVQNRILQYRNQTYSEALEETVGMFLKAVPEPSTVNFSKKIIQKLARQKRRKRRTFERKEVEEDFKIEAKQFVNSWLRRNGLNELEDDQIDPAIHLTNDEKLELTRIDDDNKTNQIDIYEYFKLLDIGVQTDKYTKESSCQYDIQTKLKTSTRGVLTDGLFKKNFQVQVSLNQTVSFKEEVIKRTENRKTTSKIVRKGQKMKTNVSKFSERSDKIKDKSQSKKDTKQTLQIKGVSQEEKNSKFSKIKGRIGVKDSIKTYLKKDEDKQSIINRNVNASTKSIYEERDSKFYQKDFTIISEKKSEQFNFDSDEEVKNWPSDQYRISISKLNDESSKINKYELSKNNENYESLIGREVSLNEFTQMGWQDDLNPGERDDNNMKRLWKYMQTKKANDGEARDSRRSMNFIKVDSESYSMKKLQKKVFNQVYEDEQINSRSKQKQREQLFQNVVRRRSFYKKAKVMFQNSNDFEQSKQTKANLYKSYIHYKPHKNRTIIQISQEEQQKVDQISKMMAIPSNLAKSKTLEASKEMFKQLSQTCKRTKKQPPKNKQYFNSSLISITKNVSALVQDYLRQIKREKDEIQTDFEKSYYPLHTILMDKMNWKYGLKDISEKKIKDFLQKILTFAPVSEKVSLYSLLFGMEAEGVGADQLLIYLKSLVYLEKKQAISSSIHILKETNIFEKIGTDRETVQENIDRLLKEFFDKEGSQIAKKAIFDYLQQNSKIISIQKISQILIRCLLKRKQVFKKDCQFLYKLSNRGNNIFTNLYKILKVYNNYNQFEKDQTMSEKNKINKSQIKKIEINIPVILKEFVKRSDVIDEIYGKSISFDRFLIAFMVSELPKSEDFVRIFNTVLLTFEDKFGQLNSLKKSSILVQKQKSSIRVPKQSIKKFCQENVKFLEDIQKKWQIKGNEKPQEEGWQWSVTKIVTQQIQTNLKGVLGKLDIMNNQIQNFFFSLQNNSQTSLLNPKQ